jgi:hypothetical protein
MQRDCSVHHQETSSLILLQACGADGSSQPTQWTSLLMGQATFVGAIVPLVDGPTRVPYNSTVRWYLIKHIALHYDVSVIDIEFLDNATVL